MQIKTITCHNVYNPGASLQAYALEKYLVDLGHEVEIVDYQPEYLRHYDLKKVNNSKFNYWGIRNLYCLLKLPGRLLKLCSKRKKNFDNFTNKYLNLTNKQYKTYEDLCKNPPKADLFLTGSDQVWNVLFSNGKDPAFYLDYGPNKAVRASYAASFACRDLPEQWCAFVQDKLKKLDFISVRESSAIKIIKKLNIRNVIHVVDPVFLLDKSEWYKMTRGYCFDDEYVFVYDFEGNPDISRAASKYANENGLKFYSYFVCKDADCIFENAGPEEFLALIQNATVVFSNSFHATAFSIIFQIPFYVFDRSEDINTRMQDLLKLTGNESGKICMDLDDENSDLYRIVYKSKCYLDEVIQYAAQKRECTDISNHTSI